MTIKLGPNGGNGGAVIRWGKHLDNGIWFLPFRYWEKLLFRFRFMRGYWNFGLFHISFGNSNEREL